MLEITFIGNAPTEKHYCYSVINNAKFDYIKLIFPKMQGGIDISTYTPYVKLESASQVLVDKMMVDSEIVENNIIITFPLYRKHTQYKDIAIQLQFQDNENDIICQSEIVYLTLANSINADKEISDLYPTELNQIESELEQKQDKLIPGENITIVDNVISATYGGRELSYVGEVIFNSELSTESQVIEAFGGTSWENLGDIDGIYQWLRLE